MSVVVATHNRPGGLARLLDGLRAQELRDFDVIVVDDGSTTDTASLLEGEQRRGELRLGVVRHATPLGPGAARNSGWRQAAAGLVAFTDDDCVPAPSWLAAGVAVHRGRPTAVIQGCTLPDPAAADRVGLLSRTVRVERLGPQYETCNIFYPRELLETLDGFDEGFGLRPGGEDTDLAWRALEAGRATIFASEAIVHHAVERLGVVGGLRHAGRWTATIRQFARHPGTRTMLYRGVFWNVWHYLLLRSLLALVMPRWIRTFLLARHARALSERAREAGAGNWAVPYLVVHDAIETWAVLRGAARYRTLVL